MIFKDFSLTSDTHPQTMVGRWIIFLWRNILNNPHLAAAPGPRRQVAHLRNLTFRVWNCFKLVCKHIRFAVKQDEFCPLKSLIERHIWKKSNCVQQFWRVVLWDFDQRKLKFSLGRIMTHNFLQEVCLFPPRSVSPYLWFLCNRFYLN